MARFAALLALALCAAPAAAFVPSVTQRHVAPARLSSASRAPAPLMMAEGEEMILVNEESIGAGASTIAGTAGFIVAGPVFGVIVAAVVNYVALCKICKKHDKHCATPLDPSPPDSACRATSASSMRGTTPSCRSRPRAP